MSTNNLKGYTAKHYGSGNVKWNKPVIVPQYNAPSKVMAFIWGILTSLVTIGLLWGIAQIVKIIIAFGM